MEERSTIQEACSRATERARSVARSRRLGIAALEGMLIDPGQNALHHQFGTRNGRIDKEIGRTEGRLQAMMLRLIEALGPRRMSTLPEGSEIDIECDQEIRLQSPPQVRNRAVLLATHPGIESKFLEVMCQRGLPGRARSHHNDPPRV